jgi:plastocyanin
LDSRFWISGLLLIATLAIGCEEKVEAPRPRPVLGSGTIKGVVKFVGAPPPRATIANQPCHDGAPQLKDETVVVNENNTLANVLVYLEGTPPSDGSERGPALLDQKDCRYAPHVVGVQVGQTLRVHSSDPAMHNVHYNATANASGNFALTTAGSEKAITFSQPEFIRVKCDVHPWMTAYIGVFDHPFFAATGEGDGSWTIDKVPSGKYTLVAWHEQYGELRQPVEVKDGQAVEANFEYKPPN